MTKLAFLGTGTMGLPMAANLLKAGQEVRAWNRTRDRAKPLAQEGAQVVQTPGEAARGADILITMLSDADAVLEPAREALGALGPDALWIQMSTVGLEGTQLCLELAAKAGVSFVDAPVLGTREPAEQGKLVILASGPGEVKERCRPIFDALGHRVLWLGEAGQGTRCKVMINSWVLGVVGVLAETITLAEALEVDPQSFFEAVEGGPLDLPYARMKGAAMIERSFEDPAFRLSLSRKDSELILEAAQQAGLEVPILRAVTERLRRAESQGHGEEDMAATYWATAPELAHSPRS
ncbi:MAG TPA: NAD(P)-dependent oxidoreductase [Solirubrobacteraceae bacterium]|nr:NAD(P)-dependent oxidoreductase [Solirubrobacteraceae bacterium]